MGNSKGNPILQGISYGGNFLKLRPIFVGLAHSVQILDGLGFTIQLTFFPVLCDTCGECLDNKDTVCACGADLADSEIVDITVAKRKNTKSVIPVILEKCWTTTKTHAKAIWTKVID